MLGLRRVFIYIGAIAGAGCVIGQSIANSADLQNSLMGISKSLALEGSFAKGQAEDLGSLGAAAGPGCDK